MGGRVGIRRADMKKETRYRVHRKGKYTMFVETTDRKDAERMAKEQTKKEGIEYVVTRAR